MDKELIKMDSQYGHYKQDKSVLVIELKNTTIDLDNPRHKKIVEAALPAICACLYNAANGLDAEIVFEAKEDEGEVRK